MAKASKTKSRKKASANKPGRLIVPGDPPIVVGGGGSTLVWINSSVFGAELTAAQVTTMLQQHPNIPHPQHPEQYRVFSCNFNAGGATVKADTGVASVRHNDMDTDRHHTVFQLA